MNNMTPTDYEKFVQSIYQSINKQGQLQNIEVLHNVKLKGKSGCNHQIDIYWEFINMGVKHKVAIECKHYKNKVSIGRVRDFFGVLEDIGNISGIFVTTSGYQSGAKSYAKEKNINLKEIRTPVDSDWNGLIKDIYIDLNYYQNRLLDISFDMDIKWIRNQYPYLSDNKITINTISDPIYIGKSLEQSITLNQLFNKVPASKNIDTEVEYTLNFTNEFLFLEEYPKLKINSCKFKYITNHFKDSIDIEGEKLVSAIIKDIETETFRFI